ncbi:MAG: type II 3-dehydroquinate dehydratase, partial [Flavobacteriales bacterium]
SNVEGEIINRLQEADSENYSGILLNAGGYTHTSVAIADAVEAIETAVIEIHISNIFDREDFRNKSLISKNCAGHISGFGLKSYELGLKALLDK